MGRPFRLLLGGDKVYSCGQCRTHLATGDELVSKHFHSRSGRAYLFHTAHNVVCGPHESRMMTTGKHIVCDIMCVECRACVGWQYILAYEESQKYKEGMCILERALVVDFEKTSPAASLARASVASSLSSGSDASLASSQGASGAAPPPPPPHLPHALQQAARAVAALVPAFHSMTPYPAHAGSLALQFAAGDSGSEDEDE